MRLTKVFTIFVTLLINHQIYQIFMKNLPSFITIIVFLVTLFNTNLMNAQNDFESDTLATDNSNLIMTFVGHGTLMFEYQGKVIHIDPVMREADYDNMPDADLILITHHHADHLDMTAISKILKDSTKLIMTQACNENMEYSGEVNVMRNGDKLGFYGIVIDAVPAYNIANRRRNGRPYHPRGEGNGYVLTIDGKKIYVAGDTENIPEMRNLINIDVAFLPMNMPYTMTPRMVATAANTFNPKILYPYHYGNSNTNALIKMLNKNQNIEVRIRNLN